MRRIRRVRQTRQSDLQCYFCTHPEANIDYKDLEILKKFISSHKKISKRVRSGLCAKHQRRVAMAIKRARIMALLPFVPK